MTANPWMVMTAALIAGLLAAGSVLAGDAATLQVIGVSTDARYLAFEQYGSMDGSGSPYCFVEFHDVERNRRAAPSVIENRGEGDPRPLGEVRATARERAAATLDSLGIDPGHQGRLLVSHLLTDLDVDAREVMFSPVPDLVGWRAHRYLLRLETSLSGRDCPLGSGYGWLASLTLLDLEHGRMRDLCRDIEPDWDRGCALGYRIQEVRLLPGETPRVAVFLNVFSVGFEGQDMRFIVVTGVLE